MSRTHDFVHFVPAEHAPNGYPQHGLTIREHFAATLYPQIYIHWRAHLTAQQCAAEAVEYADALIAELAKVQP